MRFQDFYSELGKLLYAIAKADGRVGEKEYDSLKTIVKEELLALEDSRDQYGTDNAYYTEMEFEFLEETFGDPNTAFNSFLDFLDTHRAAFSPELKLLTSRISERIAKSEYGINQKERKYLEKLFEKMNA